eukprot:535266-Rhodomonas_salina.2
MFPLVFNHNERGHEGSHMSCASAGCTCHHTLSQYRKARRTIPDLSTAKRVAPRSTIRYISTAKCRAPYPISVPHFYHTSYSTVLPHPISVPHMPTTIPPDPLSVPHKATIGGVQ